MDFDKWWNRILHDLGATSGEAEARALAQRAWDAAKAQSESCDHDFARDPQPTHHCDPQRVREKVLREALDAVPQDICTHDGCDKESTCPLTRVNVAISALLSPEKAK